MEHWWIWLLIAIAIILLLWWLASRSKNKKAAAAAASVTAAATTAAAATSHAAKEASDKVKAEAEHLKAEHEQHKAQKAAAEAAAKFSRASASAPKIDFGGGAAGLPDLEAGRAAIGHSKKLDPNDLTVVEGIGPKISSILNQGGISTWHDLAATDPSEIQDLLHQAGPQYNIHQPHTWPQQAALLKNGQWDEFNKLTAQLKGGVAEA